MFARVHKSQLTDIGGTICNSDENTGPIPTSESREKELLLLNKYREKLDDQKLSKDAFHKELSFMANNRQLGEPRIGEYANLQWPEPLHLEVNNWEHLLYVMYIVPLQKN